MPIKDFVTHSEYVKFHKQISKERGRADSFTCSCGEQARDWAHIIGTDIQNVLNYQAMCRSCHKKYDCTDELRAKFSEVRKGVKRPAISAALKGNQRRLGKSHDAEALQKMSLAKKGKPWSEARRRAYEERWCAK